MIPENIERWSEIHKWLLDLNRKYAGQIYHFLHEDTDAGRITLTVFWFEWGGETHLVVKKTLYLQGICKDEFEEIETKINETIDKLIRI